MPGSRPPLHAEPDIGQLIYDLACRIYPICRSITGDGVRHTLAVLSQHVPIEIREVPTGTAVFDWIIPPEWSIRAAYIRNPAGEKIIDFDTHNLHVVSYSTPVHTVMPLAQLKEHIHTLPEQPDLIPYRTSYYTEQWGFCMSHRQLQQLPDGPYEVFIDSRLEPGSLTYGEYLHQGHTDEEFLFSAHVCHPSLANDNCSGLALIATLAERLARVQTKYSYRFLLAPGTIGAIAWLAANEELTARIRYGLVLSCVGDGGGPTYKKSRSGTAMIDRVMSHVFRHAAGTPTILEFSPYGYDERQFCSPGFNLPVGMFQRSRFGMFSEYHTSADDLSLIRPEHLLDSYRIISAAIDIVERDWSPLSLVPKCEPQLGRRGLYSGTGGGKEGPRNTMAFLWVLNFADGAHTLLDIAERADLPFSLIADAAELLRQSGLIVDHSGERAPL